MKSQREIVAKKLLRFNKICKMDKLKNNKLLKSLLNTNGEFYITPPFYCETGNITLGDNAVIGAGSVVIKDILPNTVAVGNPCKPIRTLE